MKITCDACGSKYSIADDKLQGRKVKVRCKNCKASILVDGTVPGNFEPDDGSELADEAAELTAEDAPKPAAKATPRKNTWTVNLSDSDSREMTTDELVSAWKTGELTSDAFVWRDGMGDWKPVLEVAELKLKLLAAKPLAAEKLQDTSFDVSFDPTAPAADKKPTGARNESSVLFSLDAIKTAPAVPKKKETAADDLFGSALGTPLGGGVLGGGADLLTAPAKELPPAPAATKVAATTGVETAKKGNTGLFAAIGIGVLVLGGAAFVVLGGSKEDPEAKAKIEAEAKAKLEAEASAKAQAQQAEFAAEKAKMEAEKAALAQKLQAVTADQSKAQEEEAKKKAEEEAAKAAAAGAKPAAGAAAAPAAGAAPAKAAAAAFDAGAAKEALSSAAASAASCAQAGGPTGSGKVEVTFAPSGRVTSANVVSGPFGGTSVGGCIATTFRKAKVPAFSGDPVTVSKTVKIN